MGFHLKVFTLSVFLVSTGAFSQQLSTPATKKQKTIDFITKIVEEGKDVNAQNSRGWTALVTAIDNNLVDTCQLLITHGADVNLMTYYHWSPLMYAIRSNNFEIVQLLVENGAELNAFNDAGQTPLAMAVQRKQRKTVKFLMEQGADTTVLDARGKTIFDYVAVNNDVGTLKLIVDQGADINMVNHEGKTCFHANSGTFYGNTTFLKPLLQYGANPRIPCVVDLIDALYYEAKTNETETVKRLRAMGVVSDPWNISPPTYIPKQYIKPDTWGNPELKLKDTLDQFLKSYIDQGKEWQFTDDVGNTFLHWVSEKNRPNWVEWAIQQGMDVNVTSNLGKTPLHRAAKVIPTAEASIRVLLEYNGDVHAVDYLGNTPLHYAFLESREKTVNMLLDKNASINAVNSFGMTPLHYVFRNIGSQSAEMIQSAITVRDADPTIQDFKGETILHLVCRDFDSFPDVLQNIIRKGGNVNQPNKMGQYPLHLTYKYKNLTEILIQNGADLEVRNRAGQTPLSFAVIHAKIDTVKALIEAGADVNSCTYSAWTPLHYASEEGSLDMIQLLIDHGADISTKTFKGESAMDIAKQYKKINVYKLLKEQSALQAANPKSVKQTAASPIAASIKPFDEKKVAEEVQQEQQLQKKNNLEIQRGEWMYHCKDQPLGLAVLESDPNAVVEAIDNGANVNDYLAIAHSFRYTPLFIAVNFEDEAMVRLLIENGADIHLGEKKPFVTTPLHKAANMGSMKMTQLLVELGADMHKLDGSGDTPFVRAALRGRKNIVNYYQDKGFDIQMKDKRGRSLLHLGVQWPSTVKFLLDQGLDANLPDRSQRTPLHHYMWTAGPDNIKTPKLLVEHGADVNAQDRLGNTCLCEALAREKLLTAKYLVENGADVNAGKEPPIHLTKGNIEIIALLINQGADIKAVNRKGRTVIHSLVSNYSGGVDDLTTLDYYLEQGLDINAKDKEGLTPVFTCIESKRIDLLEALIERGADLEAVDSRGRTPLWHAVSQRKESIVRLLLKYNVKTDLTNDRGRTMRQELGSSLYDDLFEIIEANS
jgi:ankyrin repeat protein